MNRISPQARLGRNVKIGDFSIVHDNAVIGDDTVVESHCVIGYPSRLAKTPEVVIGPGSLVRTHSVIYQGCQIGACLMTGHAVHIRENTHAGRNWQVGTNSDIQGDCTIGDFVKMHSEVHISKGSRIGHFVWVYPRTQFTNDPFPPSHILESTTVEDLAVIATNTLILPGVRIGLAGFVAAGSVVRGDVPDLHCVHGSPAKTFALISNLCHLKYGLTGPWPNHYRDAYPEESYPLLDQILLRIDEQLKARRSQRGAA